MDAEVLSSICNGLGYRLEGEDGCLSSYVKGEYCLDNLKDLQRFLRRDDPQGREVFKQICKWNLVSRHLIPMIENYRNDRDVVINGVKVLVFLTMPVDPASDDIGHQMEYLWQIKAAVTRNVMIAVVVSLLEESLEHLDRNAFTEDDWKLVQLVLTLFRNILGIQDILLQHKASGSSAHFLNLRDRFLELLFQENVMDLILALTLHLDGSSSYIRKDNLLLLEIFYYIFQGQEPELIAKVSHTTSEMDAAMETSLNTLKSLMEKEQEERRLIKQRQRRSTSHSQCNGAFTRLSMDGSRTLFKGNPTVASGNCFLKTQEVQRGPVKRIAWDHGIFPATKKNTLLLLFNFLQQYLAGAYNVLMQSVREDIEMEHHEIQANDIVIFFHVACFITSFQHHRLSVSTTENTINSEALFQKLNDSSTFQGNVCGPIAETMNEATFFLVILKWRYAFDSLKLTNDYKLLSSAGSLLKSMMSMLDLVLKFSPEDSNEHQTARVLLYKLFYDQTDQGMTCFILNAIKCFDTHKQPKSDVADLVEILHTVLQLMEKLQQHGTLRVSRKARKGRKKKISGDGHGIEGQKQNEHELEAQKQGQGPDNTQNDTYSDCQNGASESIPSLTMKDSNMVPSSSGDHGVDLAQHNLVEDLAYTGNQEVNNDIGDRMYRTEGSEDEHHTATNEVDFRVSNILNSLANNAVIQRLFWLLRFYKNNSASVNCNIISILQRISDDLELAPMLFQLSVLTICYDILDDQKSSKCNDYKSIIDFLTKLVRRMLKRLKTQPLLFVELLLWKTRKECHYINAESLLHSVHNIRREIRSADNGEVGPMSGIPVQRSIADSLGDDEADLLISNNIFHHNIIEVSAENFQADTSNNETRSGGLPPIVSDGKGQLVLKKERVSARKKKFILDQEQEKAIRELYEKYKDDKECNQLIAEALDPHGKVSRLQISRKLRQLGLSVISRKRGFPVHQSSSVENQAGTSFSPPDGSTGFDNVSSHARKRVRAFSKEQELMVRDLYEKFKDHKRCTLMIANALGAENRYTAAQVSHKLKQLGLRVPLQRLRKVPKNSDDMEFSEKGDKSDDETLASLLQRRRVKAGSGAILPPTSTDRGNEEHLLPQVSNEGYRENQALDDESAGSGDDLSRTSSMRTASRRKLKMVMDADDD